MPRQKWFETSSNMECEQVFHNKTTSINPKDKSWFNQICQDAARFRLEAYKVWRLNANEQTHLLCKLSRSICNPMLLRGKALHERQLHTKVLTASKCSERFWPFVKRIGNTSAASIPIVVNNHRSKD